MFVTTLTLKPVYFEICRILCYRCVRVPKTPNRISQTFSFCANDAFGRILRLNTGSFSLRWELIIYVCSNILLLNQSQAWAFLFYSFDNKASSNLSRWLLRDFGDFSGEAPSTSAIDLFLDCLKSACNAFTEFKNSEYFSADDNFWL